MSDSDTDTSEASSDSQDIQPLLRRHRGNRLQRMGPTQDQERVGQHLLIAAVLDVFDESENSEMSEEADEAEVVAEAEAEVDVEIEAEEDVEIEAEEDVEIEAEVERPLPLPQRRLTVESISDPAASREQSDDEEAPPVEQDGVIPVAPDGDDDQPSTSRQAQPEQQQPPNESLIVLDSQSPPKKRKRPSDLTSGNMGTPVAKANDEEVDDGMTCTICLESWEMSGDHRLVSLRCGHLFGDSCIRRWLIESQRQSSVKVCPQCKTKATTRDIRCLYAKRLRAIDRTEEYEMRRDLDAERRRAQNLVTELATVKMEHSVTASKLKAVQLECDRLSSLVRAGCNRGEIDSEVGRKALTLLPRHRLYMEKNFDITRDPGCRVMLYSAQHTMLVASQKSPHAMFSGYGLRFIHPFTFKLLNFLHTSILLVRDIAFSETLHMLSVASRESRVKAFDSRMRHCSSAVSAHDKLLWSCAVDRDAREHILYAGDLRGGVYVYDVRYPDNILSEFQSTDNFSPVINIAAVPPGKIFPYGGFLVCQLSVLTFYEYVHDTAVPTRLDVAGPFLSMQYDAVQDSLLISARNNAQYPQSRFILGKLLKVDGVPVLKITATVFGSSGTPYITRPTQLGVEDNTVIVGYLQDSKQLMMYDVRREERVQTVPVNEVVYDICPLRTPTGSYLAALNECKCRIYKVISSQH
ncbi:E3 ubiquitin-protein ligase RFWD3 [Drosophila grimshawi]|uniref:RING-type E3 ubiquitin transferase n=1 Tax=Drosophila grimshawi TaxID=7222 RepID=B4IXF8_DROGR|nr:E3 ubiquitin-protein ligase RFWD3 [Drosophila grimshawi]EDV96395.1 GH15222 [Drosophila grimshawi]